MKTLMLFAFFLVTGCANSTPKQVASAPEEETYFAAEPTPKTRVITYHVQAHKFSTTLQNEYEKALANLVGKCWVWAVLSYKETALTNGPEYCVKFVKFTKSDLLKPYKLEATDKKMLLTALDQEGNIQVQNFVWDGARLQRVRNSDSKLPVEVGHDRFLKFMMLWALK